MIYLLSALLWFSSAAFLHVLFNKIRLIVSISQSYLLSIFVLGFVGTTLTNLLILTDTASSLHLPLSGILLYTACALSFASVTATPSLGDISPSLTIVVFLLRNGPQTENKILSLFTDELIRKRLRDLVDSRLVEKKGASLIVTKRGKSFARIFVWYRRFLGISEGG